MLSPQLFELLRMWWREARKMQSPAPLWLAVPRQNMADPITTRLLHSMVQEAAEVAGIPKRIKPHTCCVIPSPPAARLN